MHKRGTAPKQIEVFVKNPLVARTLGKGAGVEKIQLAGEAYLGSGPTSSRVVVVDHNGDLDETFEPVGVLASGNGFDVGRRAHVDNFKFHQVNVWALITRALRDLEDEKILGRRVPWAFEGGRLLVIPHAGYWENAFYDRDSGALHFFYFEGKDGRPVYTCLSHDIVTHELGHAVLDGLKPYYNEITSPDVAGFHEYFGDAIAMSSTLSIKEVAKQVALRNKSGLSGPNLISEIATEFGSALYRDQPYLRSGRTPKRMSDVAGNWEEHDYSLVLLGAFYDVLRSIYPRELKRQKRETGKKQIDGGMAVAALIDAARFTSRLMLRAVDCSRTRATRARSDCATICAT